MRYDTQRKTDNLPTFGPMRPRNKARKMRPVR